MRKIALLFSGQGVQYPGMGAALCESFPEARAVYDRASEAFGFDVLLKSREGTKEELAQTGVSQPLIYTLSTAAFAALSAALAPLGIRFEGAAGFSLGECSALTAAGAMTPETGFTVIATRAQAMQRAAERMHSAMYAVIGRDAGEIERLCRGAQGYVAPVNYNCPGQIVIAGEEEPAAAVAQALQDAGARVVRLAVGAAFHSELMRRASEEFYAGISSLPFGRPCLPLYSNLTGDGRADYSDIPAYLRRQMVSPVRFADEMTAMAADGFDTFVELGPGKTLCGFIRKGIPGAQTLNIDDPRSFEKCLTALTEPRV